MKTKRLRLWSNRSLPLICALALFASVCCLQSNAPTVSAQSLSNSILEVVPTTPLANVTAGANGTFYLEAQVFLNRTVNTSNCTVSTTAQQTFFNGGNMVGTLRIWGVRTGTATTNASNTNASTQATNLSNTAVAVVNMSLDLPSFNGSLEMQGTLGRTRQDFESLFATTGGFGNGTGTGQVVAIPLDDAVAITGGTGVFRGASGEATLTPLLTPVTNSNGTTTNVNCTSGAFRLTLSQVRRSSVFNIP
jgi:hypothetical protein